MANETQKSGINPSELRLFYEKCLELKLNVVGTMCIPPENEDPKKYFKQTIELNKSINLNYTSMGMTNDYLEAIEYQSSFLELDLVFLAKDSGNFNFRIFINYFA